MDLDHEIQVLLTDHEGQNLALVLELKLLLLALGLNLVNLAERRKAAGFSPASGNSTTDAARDEKLPSMPVWSRPN